MSTRNPTSWTLIGDTVRDAQNTLAQLGRLDLGQRYLAARVFLDSIRNSTLRRQARYPQSLGELCLEAVSESLLKGGELDLGVYWTSSPLTLNVTSKDTYALRRAMWHREA